VITLALDASTYTGDVALLDDTRVLAEESLAMRDAMHERLMPAVATVLGRAGVDVRQIERVVCGAGPGSFTSLRIAGSIAKGIAAGVGVPLYAVPSMALLLGASVGAGRYLTALDALRGELYVALYQVGDDAEIVELEPAGIVATDELATLASRFGARVVSPVPFENGVLASPRAAAVAHLGELLAARGPVDLAAWEPSYGRLAEAQVKWESAHGRPLPVG
jgi:tRNA threonylcarbamoyladenosine biosynthesis protein TsaB